MTKTMKTVELDERGWTRELRQLYLTRRNSRFDRADVEAAEATDHWKRDAARAAAGHSTVCSTNDLRSRGWSRTMIKELLGEPDQVVQLTASHSRVMHLYRAARVEALEKGQAFRDRAAQAAKRSAAAHEAAGRRTKDVREAVTEMVGQLGVDPPEDEMTLVALALEHQQALYDRRGDPRTVLGADAQTVERWCQNYLRHVCSNYDDLLRLAHTRFKGVPGATEIHGEIIRPQIDHLVEDAMSRL